MRMSLLSPRSCLLFLILLIGVVACRDPTQIELQVSTDVPYAAGRTIAFTMGPVGQTETRAPNVVTDMSWGADGRVGSLVVTPSGDSDESVEVKVIMGVGRAPESCTIANSTNCIITRRQLSFVPNRTLHLPIGLFALCEGVPCGANTTCNALGACVTNAVDAQGCASGGGIACLVDGDEVLLEPTLQLMTQPDAGETASCGDNTCQPGETPVSCASDCGAMGAPTHQLIAVGRLHSCATISSGALKCWGVNIDYALGLGIPPVTITDDPIGYAKGDQPGEMGNALASVDLAGRTPIAVAAGWGGTAVILSDATTWWWGSQVRALGMGNETALLPVELDVGTGRFATVIALSIGGDFNCVIRDDGSLKCWGDNSSGQLGTGGGELYFALEETLPVVNLGEGRTVTAVALGATHTCAILNGGSVKCWGGNEYGQLGLGDQMSRGQDAATMGDALPEVSLGTGVSALSIAAGDAFTCARLSNGSVKCWGVLGDVQFGTSLGDEPGEMGDALPAIDLGVGQQATALVAGTDHACVIVNDGQVRCWGANERGALGRETTSSPAPDDAQPVQLGTGLVAVALSAGSFNTCARFSDGSLKCWGKNSGGELGLGDTEDRGDDSGEMGDALPFVQLEAATSPESMTPENPGLDCTGIPDNTVCRSSLGVCDREERCDGIAATCPADERVPIGAQACSAGVQCDQVSPYCPVQVGTCAVAPLPRSAAIASSTVAPNSPDGAIDRDVVSHWQSEPVDPSWLYVDLASNVHISEVVIDGSYYLYQIQVAQDGTCQGTATGCLGTDTPWVTIYERASSPIGVRTVEGIGTNTVGRYVRMLGTERTTPTSPYRLYELTVNGDANAACAEQ
jgi:alpha-tubulin suppressor-like RCC1 family protein